MWALLETLPAPLLPTPHHAVWDRGTRVNLNVTPVLGNHITMAGAPCSSAGVSLWRDREWMATQTFWDPFAGPADEENAVTKVLVQAGARRDLVHESDLQRDPATHDFLDPQRPSLPPQPVDFIITNPPYSRKTEILRRLFALVAQGTCRKGFAVLVPLTTLEGVERAEIFRGAPAGGGISVIVIPNRVNYLAPSAVVVGRGSARKSPFCMPFNTSWFVHGAALMPPSSLLFSQPVARTAAHDGADSHSDDAERGGSDGGESAGRARKRRKRSPPKEG